MVVGKLLTKIIQTLPTWEVTKYYGRVCWFQLKCLKYKVQTSEAWFNFKCKFLPGSLEDDLECEDVQEKSRCKKSSKNKKKLTTGARESQYDDDKYLSESSDNLDSSYDDDGYVQQKRKKKCKSPGCGCSPKHGRSRKMRRC